MNSNSNFQVTMGTTPNPNSSAYPMSPPPNHDALRHVTSSHDLLTPPPPSTSTKAGIESRRPSKLSTGPQGVNGTPTRMGTRSPNSIPSSPSSIHSSSSAIFERDIEQLPASLLSSSIVATNSEAHHQLNPQFLENAVPAVLSSAVEALALADDSGAGNIAVIAPTSVSGTGVHSPVRSMSINASRSHSPSPTRRSFSVALPPSPSPAPSPERERPQASFGQSVQSLSPPASASVSPSLSPISVPGDLPFTPPSHITLPVPLPVPAVSPLTPTPQTGAGTKDRSASLTFVSYNDLLSSAPLSSTPMSHLVSPASSDPPPHIPALSVSEPVYAVGDEKEKGDGGVDFVGLGGEWEREGFGRGLEARLEEWERVLRGREGSVAGTPTA